MSTATISGVLMEVHFQAEKDHNCSDRGLILRQSHLLAGLADTRPSLSEEDKLKFEMM